MAWWFGIFCWDALMTDVGPFVFLIYALALQRVFDKFVGLPPSAPETMPVAP